MKKPLGEKLAAERGETRIRFADTLAEASGSDVFIASGSLHYFEQPLHEILRKLERLPNHVFVNRTPYSAGADLITVQDNRSFLVPCKLHSRAKLVAGMQALGYELVSEWPVSRATPGCAHAPRPLLTHLRWFLLSKETTRSDRQSLGHQAQGFLPREIFLAQTKGNTATLFTLSFATEVPGGVG
jgi:putative methyltransferase (TIGR04325 family)